MSEAAERTADIGANAEHTRDGAVADIRRTARFSSPEQITERARRYFDGIALPLDSYLSADEAERRGVTSVILPAAVHDSSREPSARRFHVPATSAAPSASFRVSDSCRSFPESASDLSEIFVSG